LTLGDTYQQKAYMQRTQGVFSEKTNYPEYPVVHWADRNEGEQASCEREGRESEKESGASQ
jgi:hypothetical protein